MVRGRTEDSHLREFHVKVLEDDWVLSHPLWLLHIGDLLIKLNHFTSSTLYFSKYISIYPDHYAPYFLRGLAFYKLNCHEQSIQSMTVCILLNPDFHLGYYYMGNSLYSLNKYAFAVMALSRSIELNKGHHESYLMRGICHLQLRDFDRAIEDFTNCLVLNSSCAISYFNRALTYHLAGKYMNAINDYIKSIDISPNAEAYFNCGKIYSSLGNHQDSISYFSVALELGGFKPDILLERGCAYYHAKTFDLALRDFTIALSLSTSEKLTSALYSYRGMVLSQKKNYEGAIHDFARATELDPTNAGYWNNRGLANLEGGHLQSSIENFSKALDIDPTFSKALKNLKKAQKACDSIM